LCEKPLAYDPLVAHRMVEACDNAGVQLFVNYMRRADPGVIEIKRLMESGAITLPIKGTAWYSKGFLHNGSHFFNLLEFWLGPFERARMLDKGRTCGDEDSEPDVQVEFEHGSVVLLAAWEEAFSHYTIELMSRSGRLRYEQGGEYITWQPPHADPGFSGYKTLQAVPILIDNDMSRYQWHVADQLANALDGKPYSLCTGRQALATLEAMHQIVNQKQS
jgi:predicted dehydrogenase